MIILGVDPGSRKTGYGIIRRTGNRHEHIENGTLYLEALKDFPARLVMLYERLHALIRAFNVTALAVEKVFYHKNPLSIQKLAEVRGVILLTGALAGLTVAEYTALQVKQAVTGYGKAEKSQVGCMVLKLLNLHDAVEENAGDALGIALCHAFQSGHALQPYLSGDKNAVTTPRRELLKKAAFYR